MTSFRHIIPLLSLSLIGTTVLTPLSLRHIPAEPCAANAGFAHTSHTDRDTTGTGFPQTTITNGILRTRLYLPDTAKGYYRGTRFDWAGVIPELEYQNHQYCGQWFDDYAPTIHDAIMGPVEAFSPLNYDRAKPGDPFVQIGVGVLTRQDAKAYFPYRYYNIINAGKWTIREKPAKTEFTHTLQDTACSYIYKKTVELIKGQAKMILHHQLKNTGQHPIETDVYDHNLFVIDHQLTGPGFTIQFPFTLSSDGPNRGFGQLAVLKNDQVQFQRELNKKEQVFTILKGYGNDKNDYDIRIENHHTGAAVRITGDKPLSKLLFWACQTTLSPEPYIQIKINPGESFDWNLTYEFYTCPISNP